MNRALLRSLGFALPTLSLVTAMHLAREPGAGEALDGVVSGMFFTLVFLVACLVRERFAGAPRSAAAGRSALHGGFTAVVVWVLLWLGWSLPLAAPLRDSALLVNSLAIAAAAWCAPQGPPAATHQRMQVRQPAP